ncbi:MAG: hypothetical protein QM598_06470 [Protaetiibacter sp.]
MITDSELTQRLERTRLDFEVSAGSREGVVRTLRAHARTRRRRRVVVASVLGVLAIGGVAAAPAAADVARRFLAQTGIYCPASSTECRGGDEMIDLGAPDVSEVVASHYPDYVTLPPGVTADDIMRQVQSMFPGDSIGTTPDSAFQATFEQVVYCAWVGEWLAADVAGDVSALKDAADAMTASTSWPGPLQRSEAQAWQLMFAQAARDGDVDGVQTAAQFNACSSFDGTTRGAWLDAHRPADG